MAEPAEQIDAARSEMQPAAEHPAGRQGASKTDLLLPLGDTPSPSHNTVRRLIRLQGSVGNATVQRMLDDRASGQVRRKRAENPHEAPKDDLDGWELTAHHVIAHSKLNKALGMLDPEARKKVLIAAVPDKIDSAMLASMKVEFPEDPANPGKAGNGKDKVAWAEWVRTQLVREDYGDNHILKTGEGFPEIDARVGDIRASFFEWQGGNQFLGPNTQTRAEPTNGKDAIDSDLQFLASDEGRFEKLGPAGEALAATMAMGRRLNKETLAANLMAILDITKNVTPAKFDASQWQEVKTLEEIEKLKENGLDRGHIESYAFFKCDLNQLKGGTSETYEEIEAGSNSYTYGGMRMSGVMTKSTSAYIPIEAAKTQFPQAKKETAKGYFTRNNIQLSDGDKKVRIPESLVKSATKYKFSLVHGGDVPFEAADESEDGYITYTLRMSSLQTPLKAAPSGESLYDYCKKTMPTSTWLPKKLYDKVIAAG